MNVNWFMQSMNVYILSVYIHRQSTSTSVEHLNSFSFLFFFSFHLGVSATDERCTCFIEIAMWRGIYIKNQVMNALRCFFLHSFSSILFSFYCYCALHPTRNLENETRKKRVKYLIWLNVELISFKLLLCLSFNRQVNTELKLKIIAPFLKGKFY